MTQQQTITNTLEEFGRDVARVLEEHGDGPQAVFRLGSLMQRLAKEGGDLWQQGEPAQGSSGLPARLLYKDTDLRFRLMLTQYPANTPTAIHIHEGWVVICLLAGSERYTSWRRVEEGSDEKRVRLELAQDHHIFPGEIGYMFNDPYNIHRQWPGDQGATEIVLMAGRGRRLHHVDEATGELLEAPSMGR